MRPGSASRESPKLWSTRWAPSHTFSCATNARPTTAILALYPVIQQLAHAAGFTEDDSPDQRLERLEKLLARATEDIDEAAPLIAALMGLDGSSRYGVLTLRCVHSSALRC